MHGQDSWDLSSDCGSNEPSLARCHETRRCFSPLTAARSRHRQTQSQLLCNQSWIRFYLSSHMGVELRCLLWLSTGTLEVNPLYSSLRRSVTF
jgi:hypothetical protein